MYFRFFLLINFIAVSFYAFAQVEVSEATLEEINKKNSPPKENVSEIKALLKKAQSLVNDKAPEAISLAEKAEKLAKKAGFQEGLADALTLQGDIQANYYGRYDRAALFYEKAFKIYKNLYQNKSISKWKIHRFLSVSAMATYKDLIEKDSPNNKDRKANRRYKRLYNDLTEYLTALATEKTYQLNAAITELDYQKKEAELLYVEKRILRDSIIKKEIANEALVDTILYRELDLRNDALKFLQQQIKLLQLEYNQEKQRILNTSYLVSIGLISTLLLVLFISYHNQRKSNKQLLEQKNVLAEKNEEIKTQRDDIHHKRQQIIDSINYAQRIQAAILPDESQIKAFLPDSFVLFKPKDIVSGDFYWFGNIGHKIIISAIDCTGHGIPGAFMSLIGNTLLDEIINQKYITEPDKILYELQKGVRTALRQEDNTNQDGMDIAICVIDKSEKKVAFAGARRPLIFIQNNQLIQIKGNKMSIGGKTAKEERNFVKHSFEIQGESAFYLFSDGYLDQFGEEENRKFMIKRFRELLLQIHQKPFAEQKAILEQNHNQWKGNNYQTDDILVLGFRANG